MKITEEQLTYEFKNYNQLLQPEVLKKILMKYLNIKNGDNLSQDFLRVSEENNGTSSKTHIRIPPVDKDQLLFHKPSSLPRILSPHTTINNETSFSNKKTMPVSKTNKSVTSCANSVIDHKIEQAMDMVKTHLMHSMRAEVESLRAKISELLERIHQLEVENDFLKSNATPEVLIALSNGAAKIRPGDQGSPNNNFMTQSSVN